MNKFRQICHKGSKIHIYDFFFFVHGSYPEPKPDYLEWRVQYCLIPLPKTWLYLFFGCLVHIFLQAASIWIG
jgi:hypothetical protein